MNVESLTRERPPAALDVLCEAFHDYPVMRYLLGEAGDDEDLRALIGLFCQARLMRGTPLRAICEADRPVAVVSDAEEPPEPPSLAQVRDQVRGRVGPDVLVRLERYGEACDAGDPGHRAHYLGMVGVRTSHRGRGHGRRLVADAQGLARADPASTESC